MNEKLAYCVVVMMLLMNCGIGRHNYCAVYLQRNLELQNKSNQDFRIIVLSDSSTKDLITWYPERQYEYFKTPIVLASFSTSTISIEYYDRIEIWTGNGFKSKPEEKPTVQDEKDYDLIMMFITDSDTIPLSLKRFAKGDILSNNLYEWDDAKDVHIEWRCDPVYYDTILIDVDNTIKTSL